MDREQRVSFSDSLFRQEVDGEIVLLDMESENYFGLDEVASEIWRLLEEGRTIAETCEVLQEIYDVDEERVCTDLEAFVERLVEQGLVRIEGE